MKLVLATTLLYSTLAWSSNFRAPAVLDGTCDLNIPLTEEKIVNGKPTQVDRDVKEILKEQCARVRQCMFSAEEDDMPALKKLETVACEHEYKAISIDTPRIKRSLEEYNGGRVPKNFKTPTEEIQEEQPSNSKSR